MFHQNSFQKSRNLPNNAVRKYHPSFLNQKYIPTKASYDVGEVDGIFEEVDEKEYNDIREKRAGKFLPYIVSSVIAENLKFVWCVVDSLFYMP